MVLKELIFNSFYFWRVVLKELTFNNYNLGGCSGFKITDF